jgi:hypothetical protein
MGTDSEGTATELIEDFNPLTWSSTAAYPSMRQWAFDTLSCPAISCECERVFSSTKKLITPERNKLLSDFSVGVWSRWMNLSFVYLRRSECLYVHWAHLAACGHLGPWYLPSWSVPVQLDCPCTPEPYEAAPPHCHSVLVSRSDSCKMTQLRPWSA